MSQLTYGDPAVILPMVTIHEYDYRAVGDDMGDTDWYLTQLRLRCTAVLNAAYVPALVPDLVNQPGINAATLLNIAKDRLLQRRKRLSLKFAGYELIPQPQENTTRIVDAMNGPKPEHCTVHELNNNTFLLDYGITAHYWVNPNPNTSRTSPSNAKGNTVLFNRWTESVDIDQTQFSTKIREGKFVIRSDNVAGKLVDQVTAQMAIVGVPPGFIRERSHYQVTADGLAIQYRVEDKEKFRLPPDVAYDAEGEYIESTPEAGLPRRFGEVHLTLRGSAATNQANLAAAAIAIGMSKLWSRMNSLQGAPENDAADATIQNAQLRVGLYDNAVQFTCRVMFYIPGKDLPARLQGLPGFANVDAITFPPANYQVDGQKRTYPFRGTAAILLKAAAYYDPSLPLTILKGDTNQLSIGGEVGSGE